MRWGRLRGTTPVDARAIGFPDAKARESGQGRQVREPDSIQGQIHPVTAAKRPVADLHVHGSVPLASAGQSRWAGMSGAAVFCGPWLVGIVTGDPASFGSDRLNVTLVEPLLADAEFCKQLAAEPEVGWADAPAALAVAYQSPPKTESGARLLQAAYHLLPFAGRDDELMELTRWCVKAERVGLRLMTGAGGQGKTRLASELCQQLSDRGWLAGLLGRSSPEDLHALAGWQGPLLVVVDYAQSRTSDVLALLEQLMLTAGPTRILLLAREAGSWWDNLPFYANKLADDVLAAAEHMRLAPLTPDVATRTNQFWSAARSFARRLGRPLAHVVEPDMSDPIYDGPLFVQLAALTAVDPGPQPPPSGHVRDDLLTHALRREDSRYWQPAARTANLAVDQISRNRAVAVATLTAAATEEQAVTALHAMPELADAAQLVVHQIARWLHDLDPGSSTFLPPLQPDLLGEAVVDRVLAQLPDLADRLLDEPVASWAHRLVSMLDLGAARFATIREARDRLLAERLAPLLARAHTTPDPELARALALAVEHVGSPALAHRVIDMTPHHTVALTELAAIATQLAAQEALDQLTHARNAGYDATQPRADRARLLNNLSNRLADLDRHDDALTAIQEAVTHYRALASEHPDAFLPNLAASLNNLSNSLADLGRDEDALTAIQEAVELRRALAAERPALFLSNLATSLNNLSNSLAGLGRDEDALTAIQEAVTHYRALATERPDAFLPNLAASLNNLSNRLADLGRDEDALTAIQEAVELRRALAVERPDVFRPDLAISLDNLSNRLADLGRREEALTAIQEAVTHYRALAAGRPDAFLPDLAMSLGNLSAVLAGPRPRRERAPTL